MTSALSYVDPFPIGLSMQVTTLMRFGGHSGTPPRQYYKCSFLPCKKCTAPASIVLAWHCLRVRCAVTREEVSLTS